MGKGGGSSPLFDKEGGTVTIIFYEFEKKNNSTKLVTGSGTTLTCQLKANTEMLNPTLVINAVPAQWNPIWNYCSIPLFQRYYFINNWRWLNGVWECDCAVDVLATWRTEIGNLEEYVLRTNSTDASVFDSRISDTIYPATCQFEKSEIEINSPFVSNILDGCYILGVINSPTYGSGVQPERSVGAITYYAMSAYALEHLKGLLLTDDNLVTMGITDVMGQMLVSDVSKQVLKTMYNPYQYIVSCMWFPFDSSNITSKTGVSTIKLGWWSYDMTNQEIYIVTAQVVSAFTENVGLLEWHPQAQYRGYYLNYAPYTKTTLIGRFGIIPVDTQYIKYGVDSLVIKYDIDIIEGITLMKLYAQHTEDPDAIIEDLITTRLFQIGVPIQLAQVGVDYMGQAMAQVNAITGIVGGTVNGASSGASVGGAAGPVGAIAGALIGAVAGGVTNKMEGTYSTTQASMPQMATSGANGSFILPFQKTTLLQLFYFIAAEDITHRGRPVHQVKKINTLSGFVMCAEGDVDFACTAVEKQLIAGFLTSGFFWE